MLRGETFIRRKRKTVRSRDEISFAEHTSSQDFRLLRPSRRQESTNTKLPQYSANSELLEDRRGDVTRKAQCAPNREFGPTYDYRLYHVPPPSCRTLMATVTWVISLPRKNQQNSHRSSRYFLVVMADSPLHHLRNLGALLQTANPP